MIYGEVYCELFGVPVTIGLTDEGWYVPGEPILSAAFDELAGPRDFGPADGDPMACAVVRLAHMLKGTYELTPLPKPPPGTIY